MLALAAELGCETVPTYGRGKNLIRWRGRVRSYRSTIPRLSIARAARRVADPVAVRPDQPARCRSPSRGPRRSPRTSTAVTLDQWLRSVHAGASTRDLMAIMARVTWGCEPDAVSMLHAVRYVKAAGGLGRMLDVEGGAQQDRFPGGTQQIAVRMAEELGERVGAGRRRCAASNGTRRHA